MKICMKVDLNIGTTFVLGTLTKGQPYSNEKWKSNMDSNLERIFLNFFQAWFKLTITTRIRMRLLEFDSGVL
jgi:hypothetical protein